MRNFFILTAAVFFYLAMTTPVSALRVKVTSRAGKPVSNAAIMIFDGGPLVNTLQTDSNGMFDYDFASLKEWCQIRVVAEGYSYNDSINFSAKPLESSKEIPVLKLFPEKLLQGKVVDDKSRPIPNAKIELWRLEVSNKAGSISEALHEHNAKGKCTEPVATYTSSNDGSFYVRHIPSAAIATDMHLELYVTADGYVKSYLELHRKDLFSPIKAKLLKEARIEGAIHLLDGSEPKQDDLWVCAVDKSGKREYPPVQVGKHGKFSIGKLYPGSYDVIAVPAPVDDPYAGVQIAQKSELVLPAVKNIQLSAGQSKSFDLTLVKSVTVTGKVILDGTGKPISNAHLEISHSGRPKGSPPLNVISNTNGEFTCSVAPGMVDVYVRSIKDSNPNYPAELCFESDTAPHYAFIAQPDSDKANPSIKVNLQQAISLYCDYISPHIMVNDLELLPGVYTLQWYPKDIAPEKLVDAGDGVKIRALPKIPKDYTMSGVCRIDGDGDKGLMAWAIWASYAVGNDEHGPAYIDANRNLNLKDDRPMKFKDLPIHSSSIATEWVTVPCRQGPLHGEHTLHPIGVKAFLDHEEWGDSFTINSRLIRRGVWKGLINTNKGPIWCETSDSNGNGIYNDQLEMRKHDKWIEEQGDSLYIDQAVSGELGRDDKLVLQKVTTIAGKPYSISVNQIGNQVIIAPYTDGGTLVINPEEPIAGIVVEGKSGCEKITGTTGVLPAGDYRVVTVLKVRWSVSPPVDVLYNKNIVFRIEKGKQTEIKLPKIDS